MVDYIAPPGAATKHLQTMELFLDFNKSRAIVLEDKECVYTLTTMNDLANVVARAVEYEGEWPVIGGVHGTTLSASKLLEIGPRVQGK